MDAIAEAAKEQSTGLREINRAVNQMDGVTQQNAAMVGDASGSSASLETEASKLRRLIAQFRLPMEASGLAMAA